ncbi:DUF7553 family protein [Natronoarchaeum rubrum]|uniref:DUF7553 family protein n=1 Tax=Natronoarchaeum rubrum TaxID=755311 RepID=UPI0021133B2F|nr:hypothetical protein [Natronoarchaeum rubrum]
MPDPPDENSDDGHDPADELDAVQSQLQHAREDAKPELNDPLNEVSEALDRMQGEETDPRPDRLESVERELVTLRSDAAPETDERLRDALERLGRVQRMVEDGTS